MALFGGTAPLIVTFLTEKVSLAPGYYLIMMTTVSLVAITKLLGKNRLLDCLNPSFLQHQELSCFDTTYLSIYWAHHLRINFLSPKIITLMSHTMNT
jgi:hypothetical protein